MEKQVVEIYLCCWSGEHEGETHAFFERSNAYRFRNQHNTSAGLQRGHKRVTAYCDHVHGQDILTTDELRLVAACYLDGEFATHEVDFRK